MIGGAMRKMMGTCGTLKGTYGNMWEHDGYVCPNSEITTGKVLINH